MKNGRQGDMSSFCKKGDVFKKKWHTWWNTINPEWRERRDGRPVIGGCGSWDRMFFPGPNGFLNILECLMALQAFDDEASWTQAVYDVRWVVQQVLLSR